MRYLILFYFFFFGNAIFLQTHMNFQRIHFNVLMFINHTLKQCLLENDNSYINVHVEFYWGYKIWCFCNIRNSCIINLYILGISYAWQNIYVAFGWVFFNVDALKNHLKIKRCIFVVYKDIVCELKQNTSLFFVKITGSEKAQMSEEQNT